MALLIAGIRNPAEARCQRLPLMPTVAQEVLDRGNRQLPRQGSRSLGRRQHLLHAAKQRHNRHFTISRTGGDRKGRSMRASTTDSHFCCRFHRAPQEELLQRPARALELEDVRQDRSEGGAKLSQQTARRRLRAPGKSEEATIDAEKQRTWRRP